MVNNLLVAKNHYSPFISLSHSVHHNTPKHSNSQIFNTKTQHGKPHIITSTQRKKEVRGKDKFRVQFPEAEEKKGNTSIQYIQRTHIHTQHTEKEKKKHTHIQYHKPNASSTQHTSTHTHIRTTQHTHTNITCIHLETQTNKGNGTTAHPPAHTFQQQNNRSAHKVHKTPDIRGTAHMHSFNTTHTKHKFHIRSEAKASHVSGHNESFKQITHRHIKTSSKKLKHHSHGHTDTTTSRNSRQNTHSKFITAGVSFTLLNI